MRSAALRITAVQAGLAAVHQHEGLGVALAAHRRRRREAGAVAGDRDVATHCRSGAHVRVFF